MTAPDPTPCRGVDGSKFFMHDLERTETAVLRLRPAALAYCATCPFQVGCAELGRRYGEGVWGGVLYRGRNKPIDLLEAS